MASASLSTSPTQIDAGSSDNVSVTNTGTVDVVVARGAQSFTLRPTQGRVVYPEGVAVTAATVSGSGSVSYTATAARASAASQFAADPAFSGTYARKAVYDVRDYGIVAGGPDASAAFASLVALGTPAAPILIAFPNGQFRFDSPWPTIDTSAVSIVGQGPFQTRIDFTRLTSGPAVDIQKPTGDNRKHIALADLWLDGPTASNTTVDAINVGSGTTFANQCVFERVRVNQFRDGYVLNSNSWNIDWYSCIWRNQARYGINSSGTQGNSGENYSLHGCTLASSGSDCIFVSSGAEFNCFGTSFDYANHLVTAQAGSRVNFFGCHFECGDAQTGDSMLTLTKGTTYNTHMALYGCTFTPTYSTAGTITTFVRITGTGGGTNDGGVLSINDLEVCANSTQAGRIALVVDNSTASTSSNATSQSHIIVNNVSYRDAGGSIGNYYPWYVQDRAGRKRFVAPGLSYGNLTYDAPLRASLWAAPAIDTCESIPRQIAVDAFTPASGDLYVVRLPMSGGNMWIATATQLAIANAAAASGLTTALVGIYDLGAENGANSTLARTFQTSGITFTTANNISSASPGVMTAGYLRTNLFGALLFVGGTSPAIYGSKAAAASPLLNPNDTRFPITVGKLAGQSALPASISVSSLTSSDFVPWMSLRPTGY